MSLFPSLMALLIFFFFSLLAPLSSSKQYFEISRPLPFSSLTPSCTSPLFTHTIAQPYTPPPNNCSWTHVALLFNASSSPSSNSHRIAAVWLAGAELLRSTTPLPSSNHPTFYSVTKDVTKYSSLLNTTNISLSVFLQNSLNMGVYHVNVSFLYYDVNVNPLRESNVVTEGVTNDLSQTPADLILPISTDGSEGFWFRILNDSDVHGLSVVVPNNTYKAVLEVYVSSHGYDEFWYSNPPDSYIISNNLTSKRGNGAYREVLVSIDGNLVGSVVPFPVIYTGGVNPLFWDPIVSIGAFDLPSYDVELTPFLGLLLDGKPHFVSLAVADSIPFWLVGANLHLWVDKSCTFPCVVQAKGLDLGTPKFKLERSSSFLGLDGSAEVEMKRKSQLSAWVNSRAGNLTTIVSRELKLKSKIEFYLNGAERKVKQKVEEEVQVRVLSGRGSTISKTKVKRKYPLTITTKTLPSTEEGTSLLLSDLDHEWKEKKKSSTGDSSSLTNRQRCKGWMVVQDRNVLHQGAATQQTYSYSDRANCYSRTVGAANGKVINDTANYLCAAPLVLGSASAL